MSGSVEVRDLQCGLGLTATETGKKRFCKSLTSIHIAKRLLTFRNSVIFKDPNRDKKKVILQIPSRGSNTVPHECVSNSLITRYVPYFGEKNRERFSPISAQFENNGIFI
jgi:hypothetical protein